MKNKIVLLLMTCSFMITFLACSSEKVPAIALGEGTEENPYKIQDYEELMELGMEDSYYYELASDIYNTEEIIINSSLGAFNGILNGNGYSIYDVMIDNEFEQGNEIETYVYVGLFSVLKPNSKIYNLSIKNIQVNVDNPGSAYVGCLAGYMEEDSLIEEINVSGRMTISLSEGHVGGIIGEGQSEISHCVADIYIGITSQKSAFYVGGIVGSHIGKINHVVSKGEININGGNYPTLGHNNHLVGGIAGKMDGEIKYADNQTDIFITIDPTNLLMTISVGGISGDSDGYIEYCIASGSITISSNSTVYAGGITGVAYHYSASTRFLALTFIDYEGENSNDVYLGAAIGYAYSKYSAGLFFYCEEIGLSHAFGNYDNTELTDLINLTLEYCYSGKSLPYFNDQIILEDGKLPRMID